MQENLYKLFAVLVFVLYIHVAATVYTPRPRGVSMLHEHLYNGRETFTCFDGLDTINFTRVNDDYCDCLDGSDEPGTSACPSGKFYCENVGYRPYPIPSSRVDDGICDCCDTSDEISGKVSCVNNCLELGRQALLDRKRRDVMWDNGIVIRDQVIVHCQQLKEGLSTRLRELLQMKTEHELIKEEKLKLKESAEAMEGEALQAYKEQQTEATPAETVEKPDSIAEADQYFIKYDTNKDGFVEVTELQVDMALDKDRNGVVTVEEAKYFLDERDRVELETFKTFSWSRIKLHLSHGILQPPVAADDQKNKYEFQDEVKEEGIDSAIDDNAEREGVDGEHYEDEEDFDEETTEKPEHGQTEKETDVQPDYDPETQRLIDIAKEARHHYAEIGNKIRQIEQEIQEIGDKLSRDYGSSDEFRSMHDECYEFKDQEYKYKLCPFDRASQQPLSGGAETTLGRWRDWSGPENNKYASMNYTNGASCWNGPDRRVEVKLKCALENKVISVTEPKRCEYLFIFETPAACIKEYHDTEDPMHDEL